MARPKHFRRAEKNKSCHRCKYHRLNMFDINMKCTKHRFSIFTFFESSRELETRCCDDFVALPRIINES